MPSNRALAAGAAAAGVTGMAALAGRYARGVARADRSWPGQVEAGLRVGERDAEHVLDQIDARGPRLIALSGHDSTPWTYDAFTRRFGDRYRTLRAGEELRITAASA